MSTYKGRPLGSIGHLGCLSFHETKNIISGEGGALLVNDPTLVERAEIIREKGTNRSQFFRGQVDKYTWVTVGSSYLPSELIAAFLWAQMEEADEITRKRLAIWEVYHQWLEGLENAGKLLRPTIPKECVKNAHMYYILLPDLESRTALISELKQHDISTVFHYVPLHSAPEGLNHGRASGDLKITQDLADRLLRLPLWLGVEQHQAFVVQHIISALNKQS